MKKIIFNDKFALTEAVLEGRKTMWRSVFYYETYRKLWEDMCRLGTPCYDTFNDFCLKRKAQYKIGEVVAVAQAYKDIEEYNPESYEDVMLDQGTICEASHSYSHLIKSGGWDNKMFVRADLMPHQIRITDIKAERLQDISDEDCMKEGIRWDYADYPYMTQKTYYFTNYEGFESPRMAFSKLINRICGRSTWEFNPWNFAFTFELVK